MWGVVARIKIEKKTPAIAFLKKVISSLVVMNGLGTLLFL